MISSRQRFVDGYPRAVDAALAVLLLAASIPGSVITEPAATPPARWWPAVLLTGVSCLVLLWRRTRIRLVAVVVAALAVAVVTMGYLPTVLLLGPLMAAVFTLADRTDRRSANAFTLVVLAVVIGLGLRHGTAAGALALRTLGPAAYLLLMLALGTTSRVRRDYLNAVHERAEAAEHNREQQARHRVAEERVRIARDLHDVVAHHIALANAQATTAAHLATTRPEQTKTILTDLAETTSTALRELKATVGLLRENEDSEAPLQPAPGLAQLPDLVGSFGAAGLDVAVCTEGTARPLAPLVDLTAFRILQEALTNVAKHSTAKKAQVRLMYSRDRLTVAVANEAGPRPPKTTAAGGGSGFGQLGMRERARAVGGTVHARPRPDGGYEVTAALPAIAPSPQEDHQP